MFVVLKKSRLEGSRGDNGALTLHKNKIDAVQEANDRSVKCPSEIYFISELTTVGEVTGAEMEEIDDEDSKIRRQFPAYEPY